MLLRRIQRLLTWIVGMHLLWTGTVLCIIFPEASAGGFWVEGPAAGFQQIAALWR